MQKVLNIICSLLLVIDSQAQQISNQIPGAFGRGVTNGIIMLEDHIGSLAVNTFSTASAMYTQGFLQPDMGTTTDPVYFNDITLSTSGYGIDNAGTTFINGGIILEFSTGEFASITLNNGNSHLLTQGILQPEFASTPLPIVGLEFTAIRLNDNEVQLTWKTLQEINSKGFYLQRQFQHDSNFSPLQFVNSRAIGGNSNTPLTYNTIDANDYSGYSYYRIKQEDLDGKFIYSLIRSVKGKTTTGINMQVWPIPATEVVNVKIEGLQKDDQILVLDMSGKVVQQLPIQVHATIQLSNLIPGHYIIRLASDKTMSQKIIVQ